jgi:predicted  nucleic acid-binding Zn-ribbon protein
MTTVVDTPVTAVRTLADRLSGGRLPILEALRYATQLGEALCSLHDRGRVHGAVAPDAVVLSADGIQLIGGSEALAIASDVSIDVLGFGAVLYALLTGHRVSANPGVSQRELTGIAAADRLIEDCMSDDRLARPLTMHKALLELKLVGLAARGADASRSARRDTFEAGLRAEMQSLEARMVAGLADAENWASEKVRVAGEGIDALAAKFAAHQDELAAAHQALGANTARFAGIEQALSETRAMLAEEIRANSERHEAQAAVLASVRTSTAQTGDLVGRVAQAATDTADALSAQILTLQEELADGQRRADDNAAGFAALKQSVDRLEARLDEETRRNAELHETQSASLGAVRRSAAQTDDLVGRLVEAMETLQESVLDASNTRR